MSLRLRASVITVAVVASSGLAATPAQAAPNLLCNATREVAREVANEADMVESARTPASAWDRSDAEFIGTYEITQGKDYEANVVLRYSPSRQCAYGLISLDQDFPNGIFDLPTGGPEVWLDTSHDEGATLYFSRTNEQVVKSGNASTYTAAFSTARLNGAPFSISIRACGRGIHTHTTANAKPNLKGVVGAGFKTERHYNEVVCTDWLTNRN